MGEVSYPIAATTIITITTTITTTTTTSLDGRMQLRNDDCGKCR